MSNYALLVSSWVMSLASCASGSKSEVNFEIKELKNALPVVTGTIKARDGNVQEFEIILMTAAGNIYPYLAIVSLGPRARNYYPRKGRWAIH